MHSSSSLFVTLQTIDAASARVLPALLTFPPPRPIEFYHTYVALNPVVTHFYFTFLCILLSPLISLLTSPSSVSSPFQSFVTLLTTLLYMLHPYLAEDNRTLKSFDLRLLLTAALVALYCIRCIAQELDPSFRSKLKSILLKEKAETRGIAQKTGRFLKKILKCGYHVGLSGLLVTPLYQIWLNRGSSLLLYEYYIMGLALGALAGIRSGTCTHTHFRCKLGFWCAIYLLGVASGASVVNWTSCGLLLYLTGLLFSGRLLSTSDNSKSLSDDLERKVDALRKSYSQPEDLVEAKKTK